MTTLGAVLSAGAVPDEDIGKAGPVGLFLILALLIVVFLLGRSMRTHLRRVPLEFPDPEPDRPGARDTGRAADAPTTQTDVLEGEVIDPRAAPGSAEGDRERPNGPRPDLG